MPRTPGAPTYEFDNDPLARRPRSAPGDSREPAFHPTVTRQIGGRRLRFSERVGAATPWRQTGNTAFDAFLAKLSRTWNGAGTSPLVAEARGMYDVLRRAGLSRLAIGMLWHEKKNETWPDSPIPPGNRNPFSVKDPNGPAGWAQYPSYEAAATAWVERISRDPYPQTGSIRDFVEIYAPSSENDVARYVSVLAQEINDLALEGAEPAPAKGKAIAVAGLASPIFVPSDLVFEIVLTPVGPNRPGVAMTPQGVTQHETGNPNNGMDARAHSRWQDSGTPGHPNGFVGVHFYVDDKRVIQKIPVNETSIHAGSPANGTNISVELCVNADRDATRAERNAMVFVAALIRDGLGKRIDALKKHNDWWPALNPPCPAVLNGEQRWESFRRTVAALIDEVAGLEATFPGLPATMPVEVFTRLFPEANPSGPVTRLYIDYCLNTLPDGLWPRFNGRTPLANGIVWWDFNPLHIFSDPLGNVWIAR